MIIISNLVPFISIWLAVLPTLNVYNFGNDGCRWEELLRSIRGPLCFYALHEWPSWGSSVNRRSTLHREKWVCGVLVTAWENEMRGSLWWCNLSDWFHHVAHVVLTQRDCKAVLNLSENVTLSFYRWGRGFGKDWIFISLCNYIFLCGWVEMLGGVWFGC